MAETPQYSFTIPSLNDDTPLDCRIYHPERLKGSHGPTYQAGISPRAAIIAHPYAPLGGSFDDGIVLALVDTLLESNFIVVTFNFRGAGDSHGRTSWTSKAEKTDYASVVGLTMHYLWALSPPGAPDETRPLSTVHSLSNVSGTLVPPTSVPFSEEAKAEAASEEEEEDSPSPTLLLAGYSYGSLILSRLPSIEVILQRFHTAETGTAASEILLRARNLGEQTQHAQRKARASASPRGRTLDPSSGAARHPQPSPVIMGGEETDPSSRRRSRETRSSGEIVRKSAEVPRKIKNRIRRRSSGVGSEHSPSNTASTHSPSERGRTAERSVSVAYLLISPLLPPISQALGTSTGWTGELFGAHREPPVKLQRRPGLAVFGSADGFTSSRKLQAWCEKVAKAEGSRFEWVEVEGAGHFWRERGALEGLLESVGSWVGKL